MPSFPHWQNQIKVKPLQNYALGPKNETDSVRDELPGEIFEGGGVIIMSVPRGGGGVSQGNTVIIIAADRTNSERFIF